MSILNRLEKLEERTGKPNAEFCSCTSYDRRPVYFQLEDDTPSNHTGLMQLQPETCGNCRKPLDRVVEIVRFVQRFGDPPLSHDPDGATFDVATEYSN